MGNNPIRYVDPDGRSEVDKSSLKDLNDAYRWRSDLNILNRYVKEALDLTVQITQKEQKIEKLAGEAAFYCFAYIKQTGNDLVTVLNLFYEPVKESLPYASNLSAFCTSFFYNIDIQGFAEACSDFLNSLDERITKEMVYVFCKEKYFEIKNVQSEIKSLKSGLKSIESEIIKLKKEMNGEEMEQ